VRRVAHPAPLLPAPSSIGDDHDQLRTLLDHVPAVVMMAALDGTIVFVNRTLFDVPVSDVIGRSVFDYMPSAVEREQLRAALASVVETGAATDLETCVHRPPAAPRWFSNRLGPVVHDGAVTGFVLIASEITERRRVERSLQESEERFRRIAEQSPDIIFRIGERGLEYISPAFATMLGVHPEERVAARGLTPRHVHPDDLARLAEIVGRLDDGPVRCELRLMHADGRTIWTEHHLMPIVDAHGKRIAVEGIVRDIGERKRAEAALQQAHRELEERVAMRTAELARVNASLRAEIGERRRAQEQRRQHQAALAHVLRVSTISEMAAGLAHEINQPLGAIANFANGIAARLRAGVVEPEALLGAATEIASEALRAGEVIRRLRDFVRRAESRRIRCDVNDVIRNAAHLVEPDARRTGIALRLALGTQLPTVRVDTIQIEQVLLNLMRNGIEAMLGSDTDAGELLVETRLSDARTIEVRVRDTGPGVPQEIASCLFNPFFTTKATGLGMGLSISRSIIEDHGGRLWAEPNVDRGSTFAFTLQAQR
jgi:PAS domain S-box-containing protein